jgi:hypothetical protein
MAVIEGRPSGRTPEVVNLSIAQTGNGASTNVVDRGPSHKNGIVRILTVAGATPTCTYAIEVSADGTNWVAATYADISTPTTDTTATFVITTSTIVQKIVKSPTTWRYCRVTYSANTNVTNTVDFLYDDGMRPPWS